MESQPTRRSHFIPRTRDGWIACISFLVIFMLAMPPVTHTLLNRSEPWIFGFPFIYGALFAVYTRPNLCFDLVLEAGSIA